MSDRTDQYGYPCHPGSRDYPYSQPMDGYRESETLPDLRMPADREAMSCVHYPGTHQTQGAEMQSVRQTDSAGDSGGQVRNPSTAESCVLKQERAMHEFQVAIRITDGQANKLHELMAEIDHTNLVTYVATMAQLGFEKYLKERKTRQELGEVNE